MRKSLIARQVEYFYDNLNRFDGNLDKALAFCLRNRKLKEEKAKRMFAEYPVKRTPAEWGFRWLWNQPEVTCVLSGMNSMEMVEENIKNANK